MSILEALVLCRFVTFAAALFLFGAHAYLAALVPEPLLSEVHALLRPIRLVLTIVALTATAALLPCTVASIGDGWGDALSFPITRDVLLETDTGAAWLLRVLGCAFLILALALSGKPGSVATGAALLLVALPFAGHASMQEGLTGWLHRLNDAGHLLAAGAWLGSLLPLLLILRWLDRPPWQHPAGVALKRFSLAGRFVVAAILATGIANTVLTLGPARLDLSSPYQLLLAAKIALVLVMVLLALCNRYILVPRITRTEPSALSTLRHSTLTEVGLGLAVLALVSIFGMLDPV
jgi:putative copper resistance protein D